MVNELENLINTVQDSMNEMEFDIVVESQEFLLFKTEQFEVQIKVTQCKDDFLEGVKPIWRERVDLR